MSVKLISAGMVIAICGLAIWTVGNFNKVQSITPLSGYSKSYSLYYPKPMPSGLYYKFNSVRDLEDQITYELIGPSGGVVLTQQAKPAQLSSFKLDGFSQVSTPNGTMYLGLIGDRVTGIVSTQGTLITITAQKDFGLDRVTVIANQLVKVK